jgi:hypothetical protein
LIIVLRFYAIFFLNFVQGLTEIEQTLKGRIPQENLDQNRLQGWRELLVSMLNHSKRIGLRVVAQHLELLQGPAISGRVTNADLNRALSSIRDMFHAELATQTIFIVPQEDAELFSEGPIFGDKVQENFPSAATDMIEAAKCLALDRHTASVLHLMRVLEVGLNVLAKDLRIEYKHANWKRIIDRIPGRIQEIESARRKPKKWHELRQFYAEAGAQFAFLKDAYRNWAMHAHKTYDEPAARDIFQNSGAFMRHLATRLRETST